MCARLARLVRTWWQTEQLGSGSNSKLFALDLGRVLAYPGLDRSAWFTSGHLGLVVARSFADNPQISLEVLLDVGVRNVGILVEVVEGEFTFTVRAFKVEFTKEVE